VWNCLLAPLLCNVYELHSLRTILLFCKSYKQDFLAFIKKSAFVIDGGVLGHRLRVPMNNIRGSSYARKVSCCYSFAFTQS
ncbi:MAG: hypothetical protein ACK56I_13765, partial [bacterium]